MRKCADWLNTYTEFTQHLEAPLKFHLWSGLSVLASVARRNIYLSRGFFNLFPNLYVTIVAPTGIGKTTATDVAMEILETAPEVEVMREKLTSYFLLDYFDQMTKTKGDCCCTIYAPEMKNTIGDLNKTEIVTLLTSFYGCPTNPAYRTKGGGVMKFKNIAINFLGDSTPEWLAVGTTANEIAGGFTGRFVYVFEDVTDRSSPFPEDYYTPDMVELKQNLIDDLVHIGKLKGNFIINDQAKAEYILWYNERKKEWKDERLFGYFNRKRDLVFKVAMLLSIAKDDILVIDEDILKLAWSLLSMTEEKMGAALSGVVDDPILRHKDTVMAQISISPNQEMTRSELLRKNWNRFDSVVLDRIISNLYDARMITQRPVVVDNNSEIMYKLIKRGAITC